MKSVAGKLIFAALSVLYPGLIFCGLYFFGLKPRVLSLALLALAAFHFVSYSKEADKKSIQALKGGLFFILTLACGSIAFALDNTLFLKFYPVAISICLLAFFGSSLWIGPNIIFKFACLGDKTLSKSALRPFIETYCRKVTLVWCGFFILNGSFATYTCFAGSDKLWTIYNGLISYILMGCLFIGEFMIRKLVQKQMPSYTYISSLTKNSRAADSIFAFDGAGDRGVKTWADFLSDVSKVRQELESKPQKAWLINFEDSYFFMVALLAIMQSGRDAKISANRTPEFIKEILTDEVGFLTDVNAENALLIQDALANHEDDGKWVKFDPHKSNVDMYTSGTTGKPKIAPKKFIQLEDEVNEYSTQYLEKYDHALVIRTVNHHHIFGLTFSLLICLMCGAPFRRSTIEFPAEIEALKDNRLVIVASPAFLKRLAGSNEKEIDLKEIPFIISAGGVLPEDAAEKTEKILKYWPSEIYGSTETGCMAHRQSKEGPLYTPFPHNKITLTEEGCLHVESPYIYDEGGFSTADMIKQEADGRFIILGRIDSIVKIEEKRISLPEVEARLRQTGFVQDVRVVAMAGKRQYLAAAIALNYEGKEHFKNAQKLEMNKFFRNFLAQYLELTVIPKRWRYPEELPQDAQGKIKTADIKALFDDVKPEENENFKIINVDKQDSKVVVEMEVPETSDYYNGHFEEFKLLPAVVQIDFVMKFANKYLDASLKMQKIQRTKFMNPIFPNTPVLLNIDYDVEKAKLNFSYVDKEGKKYSNGCINLSEA